MLRAQVVIRARLSPAVKGRVVPQLIAQPLCHILREAVVTVKLLVGKVEGVCVTKEPPPPSKHREQQRHHCRFGAFERMDEWDR